VLYVAVFYGGVVVRNEQLLEELNGEGALAHSPIPHYHQLICLQVVIWGSGHGSSPTPTYCAHGGCSRKAAWAASSNNSVTPRLHLQLICEPITTEHDGAEGILYTRYSSMASTFNLFTALLWGSLYYRNLLLNVQRCSKKRRSRFKTFLTFRSLFTNTLQSSIIYRDLSYRLPYLFLKNNK
jgi:hypothetical protein